MLILTSVKQAEVVGGGELRSLHGMEKITLSQQYDNIISIDNLLEAWKEFLNGKRGRKDVQEFELNLMGHIISLHRELLNKTYEHSSYETFGVADPKPRSIHKASVRDRLLHHALYRTLYPFFDRTFIADSYSCRVGKGTHKAMERFETFSRRASKNGTKTVWVLKCDIKKFFASVDQAILIKILEEYIKDGEVIWLLSKIIKSFSSTKEGIGLPLGNLTSQLLVNIYMNRFDQFVKHRLKAKYYIRYADDFVVMDTDKDWLLELLPKIADFLSEELKLSLHPDKVFIKTLASGVDFLGWVHFTDHRVLRTVAKRRMFRGIERTGGKAESVQSYLGLLSHGNGKRLTKQVQIFVEKAGNEVG